MKTIEFIFIISFCVLCFSCHRADNRFEIKNNTADSLYVRLLFDSEIQSKKIKNIFRGGLRKVSGIETKGIGFYGNWEQDFTFVRDTLINVILMDKQKIDNTLLIKGLFYNSHEFHNKKEEVWDSMYNLGDYEYKKYSLQELKELNFRVTYPDDGFKQGEPMKKE